MYYVIYDNAKLASFKSKNKHEADKWLSSRSYFKKGIVVNKKPVLKKLSTKKL